MTIDNDMKIDPQYGEYLGTGEFDLQSFSLNSIVIAQCAGIWDLRLTQGIGTGCIAPAISKFASARTISSSK